MTHGRGLPRLHVITDAAVLQRRDFLESARGLLAAMSAPKPLDNDAAVASLALVALHLRGRVSGRLLFDLATELRPAAQAAGALLLINDRIDIARAIQADGAQLGQGSLPVAEARRILESGSWVGASVHTADEAVSARGADFLIVGNIWETASHPGRAAAGTSRLERVAAAADQASRTDGTESGAAAVPLIAIGGVTPDRVAEALSAGAHGVAVLNGIWSAPSPSEAAFRYLEALQRDPQTRNPDP